MNKTDKKRRSSYQVRYQNELQNLNSMRKRWPLFGIHTVSSRLRGDNEVISGHELIQRLVISEDFALDIHGNDRSNSQEGQIEEDRLRHLCHKG